MINEESEDYTINWKYVILAVIVIFGLLFAKYKINNNRQKIDSQEHDIEVREDIIHNQSYVISASNQSPSLSWVKDGDLKLLYLNPAFEEHFLLPYGLNVNDYIGYDDFKVFDSATANTFRYDDSLVLDCFCTRDFYNKTVYEGDSVIWKGWKYPVIFIDGDTGIAGEGTFTKIEIDGNY